MCHVCSRYDQQNSGGLRGHDPHEGQLEEADEPRDEETGLACQRVLEAPTAPD